MIFEYNLQQNILVTLNQIAPLSKRHNMMEHSRYSCYFSTKEESGQLKPPATLLLTGVYVTMEQFWV
jgi:hypothetical protein